MISAFYSQSLPLSSLSNISDLLITTINGIPKLILIALSWPSIYCKYYVTKIYYIKIPLFFMSSNSYNVNFNSESNDYMTVIHLSKSSINVHGSYISKIMHINVFLIVLWFKIYDKRYF